MNRARAPSDGPARPQSASASSDIERSPSKRLTLTRGVSMVVRPPDVHARACDDGHAYDPFAGGDQLRCAGLSSLACWRSRSPSARARADLDVSMRHDLLNAFAKFSPASVHAELAHCDADARAPCPCLSATGGSVPPVDRGT